MKCLAWDLVPLKRTTHIGIIFCLLLWSDISVQSITSICPLIFLHLNAKSFTLCAGQILAWHLHSVALVSPAFASMSKKSPFQIKGRFNVLKHSCPLSSYECVAFQVRFADFQNGRCSKALAPVAMSWCLFSKPLMNQNICIICGDVPKLYCSHKCFWVTNSEMEIFF